MTLLKQTSLVLFGLLSGFVGFLSLIVGIMLIVVSVSDISDPLGRLYMLAFKLMVSEILLAFGVAASLLSLRYLLGRREWLIRATNYTWQRAMRYSMILWCFNMAVIAILLVLKLFVFES